MPSFNPFLSLFQGIECLSDETFIPGLPVETLMVTVFPEADRCNEPRPDTNVCWDLKFSLNGYLQNPALHGHIRQRLPAPFLPLRILQAAGMGQDC